MNGTPVFRQTFAEMDSPNPIDADRWQRKETGGGSLKQGETGLRLLTTDTTERVYSNAQIDDYQGRARRDFLWRPPLTLAVRARFSHPAARPGENRGLSGTAGFGFWNDPFLMTGAGAPALPRALWFFYASPPSDILLDSRTPGFGWKASALDASRPGAVLLALTAPLTVPLMNIRAVYRAFWPSAQRVLGIREAVVSAEMTDWHTYTIEWGVDRVEFQVDHRLVLECDTPPRGPLGLVIWLDNQYLIAAPWGRLRHGLLATPGDQWLELEWVQIQR